MSTSIVHPTNRVFPNGEVIPTSDEGYEQGYTSGLTWPDAWDTHRPPGGPWCYTGKHEALVHASRTYTGAWRQGWKDGYAQKLALKAQGLL